MTSIGRARDERLPSAIQTKIETTNWLELIFSGCCLILKRKMMLTRAPPWCRVPRAWQWQHQQEQLMTVNEMTMFSFALSKSRAIGA